MDAAELRAACLEQPGTFESFPFGPNYSVFKIEANGKLFAISALDPAALTVSLKCDPDESVLLRGKFDGILPGYHLNKRHWITVLVGSDVPDDLLIELIEDSYDLVKPKRQRG